MKSNKRSEKFNLKETLNIYYWRHRKDKIATIKNQSFIEY